MSRPNHWCRTCTHCLKYRKESRKAECGHIGMMTLIGYFPINKKTNCVLWEKKSKEGKDAERV